MPIYDGNLKSIFVKRSSKENNIDQVLITGNIGDEETEIVIDESCNICESSAISKFTSFVGVEKEPHKLVRSSSSSDDDIDEMMVLRSAMPRYLRKVYGAPKIMNVQRAAVISPIITFEYSDMCSKKLGRLFEQPLYHNTIFFIGKLL